MVLFLARNIVDCILFSDRFQSILIHLSFGSTTRFKFLVNLNKIIFNLQLKLIYRIGTRQKITNPKEEAIQRVKLLRRIHVLGTLKARVNHQVIQIVMNIIVRATHDRKANQVHMNIIRGNTNIFVETEEKSLHVKMGIQQLLLNRKKLNANITVVNLVVVAHIIQKVNQLQIVIQANIREARAILKANHMNIIAINIITATIIISMIKKKRAQ